MQTSQGVNLVVEPKKEASDVERGYVLATKADKILPARMTAVTSLNEFFERFMPTITINGVEIELS